MSRSESPCLLLIRHGKAGESDPERYPDDDLRPLTSSGRREFAHASRGLRRLGFRPLLILTSPVLRAHETAEILRQEAGFRACALVPLAQLRDDASPREALEALKLQSKHLVPQKMRPKEGPLVALVGHEPWMGDFLARLLFGKPAASLPFKKGGCALVELEGFRFGAGRLLGFYAPEALHHFEKS